jgi:epoxyqueuosine reductase QueG
VEEKIREWIEKFIEEKNSGLWRKPVIGFCDAGDKMFSKLRKIVSESHLMPEEALNAARSVIVYFIPFSRKVVESNIHGRYSSRLWAEAYVETNKLIVELNNYIARKLELHGYSSLVLPPTHNFDEEKLVSDWSHKHVAYISGIGTFGRHTMLITESGCCGRLGSLITQTELDPGERIQEEYCLWKKGEECSACVRRCRFGALTESGFDRQKCYSVCLENDAFHSDLPLTDVCGKCACGVPCSMQNPLKTLK